MTSEFPLNERPVHVYVAQCGYHVWLEFVLSSGTWILERNDSQPIVCLQQNRACGERIEVPEAGDMAGKLGLWPFALILNVNTPTKGRLSILLNLWRPWRDRLDCVSAVCQLLEAYGVILPQNIKTPWGLMRALKRRYRG